MTVDKDVPSVVVKDLVKTFGDFTAVDHISIEAYPGEIFGFLGPNGAGKSTTIRILRRRGFCARRRAGPR